MTSCRGKRATIDIAQSVVTSDTCGRSAVKRYKGSESELVGITGVRTPITWMRSRGHLMATDSLPRTRIANADRSL